VLQPQLLPLAETVVVLLPAQGKKQASSRGVVWLKSPALPLLLLLLQDVEGCFVGDDLYVVQTRPQP
jgi:hypothetical protein